MRLAIKVPVHPSLRIRKVPYSSPMTKNVSTDGVRVAATPAPAANPPAAIAAAMIRATTKFFTSGIGLSIGVYARVRATEATIVVCV